MNEIIMVVLGMVLMGFIIGLIWLWRLTQADQRRDKEWQTDLERKARLKVLRGEPVPGRLICGKYDCEPSITDKMVDEWQEEAAAIQICARKAMEQKMMEQL